MKVKFQVIGLVGVLILMLLMPFGINYLIPTPSNDYYISTNYTCIGCIGVQDPSILIILSVVIPLVILVGLLLCCIPKKEKEVLKDD